MSTLSATCHHSLRDMSALLSWDVSTLFVTCQHSLRGMLALPSQHVSKAPNAFIVLTPLMTFNTPSLNNCALFLALTLIVTSCCADLGAGLSALFIRGRLTKHLTGTLGVSISSLLHYATFDAYPSCQHCHRNNACHSQRWPHLQKKR